VRPTPKKVFLKQKRPEPRSIADPETRHNQTACLQQVTALFRASFAGKTYNFHNYDAFLDRLLHFREIKNHLNIKLGRTLRTIIKPHRGNDNSR
jgi:hypothetical protein